MLKTHFFVIDEDLLGKKPYPKESRENILVMPPYLTFMLYD